jgi:hypothetical protein
MNTRRTLLAAAAALMASLAQPQAALATPSLLLTGNLAYSCSGRANGNGIGGINLPDGFYAGDYKCK